MDTDNKYMRDCIALAKTTKENGNTPVGSVIVSHGKIIAQGMEGEKILPSLMSHAENVAILKAIENLNQRDLSDCVLYTTVEPCFMCTYLIRQMKIKKVVYGTTTPTGGDSSAFPILKTTEIKSWPQIPEVRGGILKKECEGLFR